MSEREIAPTVLMAASMFLAFLPAGCGGSPQTSGVSPQSPYTAFSNPTPVTITGYSGDAMEPFISKNAQYLFFNNRNDPSINTNLFYASRVDDQTFDYIGPVPGVNSSQL